MKDVEHWDLIVVGAGTAGLACAITAAAAGARVCVLEKDSEIGGTLHITAGQMSAGGTRRQKRMGIEDSWKSHFDEVMRIGRYQSDAQLLRLAVQEAPNTLDWLEELGFEFFPGTPLVQYGLEPFAKARTTWGAEKGAGILKSLLPLFQGLQASKRLMVFLRHRLLDLVLEGGVVTGVSVEGQDRVVDFRGAATALCTGGYGSNPDLFSELHPGEHCLLGARATSTGDGLMAARRIGAQVSGSECHLPTYGCLPSRVAPGRTDVADGFGNLTPQYRSLGEIIVNVRGHRFFAEDNPSADARQRALAGQGGQAWIVFDEGAIVDDVPIIVGWSRDRLQQEAAAGHRVWRANDPVQLAARAGIESAGLCDTLQEYNMAVRDGRDRFGRTRLVRQLTAPPYYAISLQAGCVLTFGGLRVDGALRVLDREDRPIPRLYAAGEILGAGALMGNAYSGGMCLTPALTLGRILGRRLAEDQAATR